MEMKERLSKAGNGREIWLSLCKEYQISSSSYVLVFPGKEREYNEPAIKHLSYFMEKKGIGEIFLLADDEWVLESASNLPVNLNIINLEIEKINDLLQFYCLYDFAPNLIVASLEKPTGRLGSGLVGKRGISSEEIFVKEIYGINIT